MEHHIDSGSAQEQLFRIPIAVWVIVLGLVAVLLAIFVFKVAVGTALTFGLIGLMVFSHLFMHGGHGSHSSHPGHAGTQSGTAPDVGQRNRHTGHSGGCH